MTGWTVKGWNMKYHTTRHISWWVNLLGRNTRLFTPKRRLKIPLFTFLENYSIHFRIVRMQPVEILDTYFPKRHITDILAAIAVPLLHVSCFWTKNQKNPHWNCKFHENRRSEKCNFYYLGGEQQISFFRPLVHYI